MNGKTILIGAASIIGVGGLLYKKINDHNDKMYLKRESEIREIESRWHHAGWNGGYEAGKRDAELDAMVKSIKQQSED